MSIPSLPAQGSTNWFGWAQALHNAASGAIEASDIGSGNSNDLALRAAFVLPKSGGYTYNTDGTVATGPDGESYAYNGDGTLHTITLNGVTRTLSYNGDGTLASVA